MLSIDELKQFDKSYYNNGISLITDKVYDIKKEQLKQKYPNHPYFQEVGYEITKNKVNLPYLLGSLNKYKLNTITKKLQQEEYIITPKLDGMSVFVQYDHNQLQCAYTRGNGIQGEDITETSKLFLPETINYPGRISLRGELLFDDTKAKELKYKSGRHAVVGLINKKTLTTEHKYINYVFYQLLYPNYDTELERLRFIKQYISCVEYEHITNPTQEQLINLHKKYKNYTYATDGLVLTLNNSEVEHEKYPDNKFSFKLNEDGINSKVIDIEWNITRTGRIVPTIIIEPITIANSTVNRITGNNYKHIINNNIGINSEVSVVLSGEIIPFITEVISEGELNIPTYCPSCSEKVSEKGVDLVCTNQNCTDNVYKRIEHFFTTLGAENVAEKTFQNLGVSSVKEAYELNEFDIAMKEGFGMTIGETIVHEIQKTLHTTPDKLLAAFGIPFVGIENAKKITNKYTLEELFTGNIDISSIDGLGSKIEKIFNEEITKYGKVYDYLQDIGLQFEETKEKKLNNMIFTLTGDGPKGRNDIVKDIERSGGSVKNISKKVNYLVTNDVNTMTTKAKKARQYNIPIIDYTQLYGMI